LRPQAQKKLNYFFQGHAPWKKYCSAIKRANSAHCANLCAADGRIPCLLNAKHSKGEKAR
jgi:hypothetical protein